jgi:signal transduction histidine kinase/ActR/RegA family two-component response regulator
MLSAEESVDSADGRESERLRVLASYNVLDTPPEAPFEELARLATRLCGTPMAVVTLVDDHRQWFKAEIGLNVRETPRSIAFCAHTIEGSGLFQVTDAREDTRFASNPLVTGTPHLRFYAGVPLQVEGGCRLGALAVLDREPRCLTPEQQADLESLARQVVLVLEERRLRILAEIASRDAKRQSDSLLMIAGRVARLGAWELDVVRQKVVWSDIVADIHDMPRGFSPDLDRALLFYVEPDRSTLARAVAACQEDGSPFDHELVLRPASGGPLRWVRAIGEAVRNAEGRITHLRGACQDITERKRAELHRETLERQLRQAQKMESIGTLAGGIAHDFNNILGAILGNVELVRDALPKAGAGQAALATISGSAQRARSLVQQILAFGRQQPTQRVAQPLRPLIEEAARLLRATLPANVALETTRAGVEVLAQVDGNQLQQVLINLCTNAWQAMPVGGGRIEIGLDTDCSALPKAGAGAELSASPCAHLWVRDDGPGMPPDVQARIFEPFFTTKPLGQGTGLGLSAAHGIIEAHGGRIEVRSQVNLGSTFHIYLPVCTPADEVTVAPALPAADRNLLKGLKVLCVDDDPVMLTTMQALLERAGCVVDAQSDPRLAADRLRDTRHRADILVTDFNMPLMNGAALVQEVKRINPDLPVVMASGFLSDKLCAEAFAQGVTVLVQKERTVEDLVAAVTEAVASSRQPPHSPAGSGFF